MNCAVYRFLKGKLCEEFLDIYRPSEKDKARIQRRRSSAVDASGGADAVNSRSHSSTSTSRGGSVTKNTGFGVSISLVTIDTSV